MRVIVKMLVVCSSWRMRCQILASLYLCVCVMSLVMLHLHLLTSPVSSLFLGLFSNCILFSHVQDLWPILSPVSWRCETCVRMVHDWVLVLYGQMFFVYGNCLICALLLPTRYSVDRSFFIWIRPFSHRYISSWTLNAILIVSFLITSNQFKRKLNLVDNNVRGCYF